MLRPGGQNWQQFALMIHQIQLPEDALTTAQLTQTQAAVTPTPPATNTPTPTPTPTSQIPSFLRAFLRHLRADPQTRLCKSCNPFHKNERRERKKFFFQGLRCSSA